VKTIGLDDKHAIEAFLRRNPFLHLYGLGDLDDRFWPETTWYGRVDGGAIRAIALLYSGLALPTLLALGDDEILHLEDLLRSIQALLPRRFYAHLSPGLAEILREHYRLDPHGQHEKMALVRPEQLPFTEIPGVERLTEANRDEVLRFYARSYPGTWFEPEMLRKGPYFGMRGPAGLVSIAGVHVWSPAYRVAALGNITTHPEHRGQGYARAVTGTLCTYLLRTTDTIGMNVRSDNAPAIACYQALGFQSLDCYEEYMAELR
jgi:ribosomal protein S18 acetylase RimI-like enzyme